MSTPRWLEQRAAWARPVLDIQAKRRARARAAHNHARQRLAAWRRRQLRDLLYEAQRDGWFQSLRRLYHYYHQRTGASEATYWRDWRALRAEWAAIEARTQAANPGQGRGTGGGDDGVDFTTGQSAPALSPSGRAAGSVGLSRRARQLSSVWLARFAALDEALRRYVPPEVVARIYAAAARGVGGICAVPDAADVFVAGDGARVSAGLGQARSSSGRSGAPLPAAVSPARDVPSSAGDGTLRLGRPREFEGAPGTAARLVRREPRRTPGEWWE